MNTKAASERYQRQVGELAKLPGNDVCADCRGRMPRWSSWNLGIFICVNCATVHRKMGTHVSKVKSLTLDTWTKEQVENMRQIGNVKSNAKYNPDERRNRPPVNVDDEARSSELERYIFDKYRGRFMASSAPRQVSIPYGQNAPPLPAKGPRDTRGAMSALTNGQEAQRTYSAQSSISTPSIPPRPTLKPEANTSATAAAASPAKPPAAPRSSSLAPPQASLPPRASSASVPSIAMNSVAPSSNATASSSVFDDLLSISQPQQQPQQAFVMNGMHLQMPVQNPAQQMNPWAHLAMQQQAVVSPMVMSHASSTVTSPFQQPMATGQGSYMQPMGTGWSGNTAMSGYAAHSPSDLGTMAFTNPTGQSSFPFGTSPGGFAGNGGMAIPSSAQMLGQNAFLSPYAQAPQEQLRATSAPTSNGFMRGNEVAMNATGTSAAGNPFGQFASSMMPGGGSNGGHAQEAQAFARGWPGTKQNNPWA